jgi:hypothetical protein
MLTGGPMFIAIAIISFAALIVVYALSIWIDAAAHRAPLDD